MKIKLALLIFIIFISYPVHGKYKLDPKKEKQYQSTIERMIFMIR